MRRALEHQQAVVHARCLHHATVERDVAHQHSQSALARERVVQGADAAFRAIGVEARPAGGLAESHLRGDAGGTSHVEGLDRLAGRAGDIPLVQRVLHGLAVNRGDVGVQLARPVQLAQNGHDAAGAVHIFDVVLVGVGRHLAQLRYVAREPVDIGHGEVDAGLMGHGQQMQDGVGRTAHGDVQRHRVLKRFEAHGARQDRLVALFVVATAQLHDQATSAQEQLLAVRMGRHHGAVARQGQAQRFGEAVHGVGREHARTGAAGWAGRALDLGQIRVGHLVVHRHHHGIHQIQLAELDLLGRRIRQAHLARLHGTARDKHHRDVQPHGRHQHAGRDLVAIGDAHQRIGAVRVHHVLDRVGNDVAAGQGIQHAVVAHGDAVVHRNGVELLGHTTCFLDLAGHQLAQILQVHMAGDKLGERVGDGDDGFLKVAVFHASGSPKRAGTGHVASGGGCFRAVGGHGKRDSGIEQRSQSAAFHYRPRCPKASVCAL